MVSPAKQKSDLVDLLGSGAVQALRLAIPLAKTIPLIGTTIEGSLEAVLHIVEAVDDVKMKKEKCQLLANRVVAIIAAITTELMKNDHATLARRENSIAALRGTLRDVQTLLKDLSSSSLVRRILKRGEVDDKLSILHQKLDTAIDTFHITENMRTEDALNQLLAAIKEGEDKRDILLMNSLLRPVMTASYLSRASVSGCFTGTRQTLLDQISMWFNDKNSQAPQIFWLSGLGGTGKTAVSHTVCERLHANGQLGASFFFSRDDADQRRVASIIPTLAFQLASVNPMYRSKLCDVLKEHPDAPSRAQQYQLQELLLHPLQQIPSLPPYLIILDALDECDKERGTEGGDLIPLILRKLPGSGLNIKVLITSRPERSIQDMFKITGHEMNIHGTTVLHNMDQSAVEEDIASYLAYHLQCIQVARNIHPPWPAWPGNEAFNDLVKRAGLFFIFAATIVNIVADTYYSPQNQLQRLLGNGNIQSRALYSQVDLLYLQVLKTSVESRADAFELCVRFQKIVGAIILLQNPLSISALAHLLEHDEADIEGALTPLHSLLNIPSNRDQPVRIFHPSFCDFLLIKERCQDTRFTIPEGRTHAQLALYCLKLMLRHLKRNICSINDDIVLNSEIPDLESRLRDCVSPALLYACQHWGDHLSQSAANTELHKELVERMSEFASTKLLYWVEVLSLEGRFPLCISNLLAAFPWCKEVIPVTYHLIYDAYRLVLDFHNVINISAVQVYNSALVFIPNCSILQAYEHELPTVHLTSPRTVEWDASLLVLEGHTSSVNMVSFSPKGGRVASASDDGRVCIWDTSNGAQVSVFYGHIGAVKSVEYSPDSSYLVSGGFDATIRIWDAITGFSHFTFVGHKGSVKLAIFSDDGCKIASGSDDKTVAIWDVLGNRQLASLNGHSGPVTCLVFLANGSQILSGSTDSTLRLWDTKTKTALKVLHCTDTVLCLSVYSSPQKKLTVLSGSQNGVITIRDVGTLEEISYLFGGAAAVKSLSVSSQVNKVVSGSSDGIIRLWDPSSESCIAEYRGHSGPVECTRFTSDGTHILSSSTDRTIRLWDATVEGVQGSEDYVMVVQIPDHTEHIASGSTKGKVALWKIDDGSLVYEVNVHHGVILSLAFTHDNKLIASASADHTICILNTDNGSSVAVLTGHTDEVYTVQFSPDDTLLVSASPDAQVIIWDVSTKKPRHSLIHSAGVGVASFSPDQKLVCSGTLDGEIHIWNVESGDRITILKGNSSPILWALFSPDGQWLASWLEDESVKVWKVEGSDFQIWPHQDWRLDRRTDRSSGGEKELVKYKDLLPDDELHYLQEDGWITLPHTGRYICWVPASRRQPWLRTLWESRKGIFATGSQAGNLTIVDLRSTLM
ncbi:WD40-repeat-containing domain protein [Mycena alexandri]|uniref:WD40-repeat-containing domain protein n=1 Tax=Mycena alexandri TaxID=1745969 RepID=A0AAD6T570_9AGAR|nr:WD40-repeat-containing domain protein [Mycena alexandri]